MMDAREQKRLLLRVWSRSKQAWLWYRPHLHRTETMVPSILCRRWQPL